MSMKLFIDANQKEVLLKALRVLHEELDSMVQNTRSITLGRPISAEMNEVLSLIDKVGSARETNAEILEREVREILERSDRGGLIYAIKHYRELTGEGLKESKVAVENIRDKWGIPR